MDENSDKARGLKQEIARLERESKRAQREAESNKDKTEKLQELLEKSKSDSGALRQQVSQKKKENDSLRKDVDRIKSESDRFKKEAQENRVLVSGLESDLLKTKSEVSKMAEEMEQKDKEAERLAKQVEKGSQKANATEGDPSSDSQAKILSQESDENFQKGTTAMNVKTDSGLEDQILEYEQAKTQMNQGKRLRAERIVSTYSAVAAGVGVVPIAVIDIAGLAAVQLTMLAKLADNYDVKYSGNLGKTLVTALLGTLVPNSLKASTIGLIRSIPVFGQLLGLATMPTYCWATTYAIGTVFTEMFEKDKDLETIDMDEAKAKVKKVFETATAKKEAAAAA